MPGKVLISGASGPVGDAVTTTFQRRGYQVSRLVRRVASGPNEISWDPTQPVSPVSVSGFDAVVHLAGESIVGRWNAKKKAAIRESRALGTRHLAEALANALQRPRVLVSASAIGYYGDRGDQALTEESAPGKGSLAEVCREWEASTGAALQAGIRVVNTRIGMVLSSKGGALQAMLPPFRLGVGGRIGSGRQWWSWIDVRDLADVILYAIENQTLRGPVNAVSPNAVTNIEFTKTLASILSRPAIFPLPAFVARLVMGQMADELILASQRVEPVSLKASGFHFRHPDLAESLRSTLQR